MDSETSVYGVAVFCVSGDLIGSADVYKRRGGWFTVEVTPFLYAERNLRKGFRSEYKAREYAREQCERFLSQVLEHDAQEHPEYDNSEDYTMQYSENGYIDNGPQY